MAVCVIGNSLEKIPSNISYNPTYWKMKKNTSFGGMLVRMMDAPQPLQQKTQGIPNPYHPYHPKRPIMVKKPLGCK